MTPVGDWEIWETLLSSVPPTPLSWSLTVEGVCELARSHLSLASCVASLTSDLRQVCHTIHGGPRTPSRKTIANLNWAFVTNARFLLFQKLAGPGLSLAPFQSLYFQTG